MKLRALLGALLVGVVVFLVAQAWEGRRSPLRRWKVPAAAIREDERMLVGNMGRMPLIPGKARGPDIVLIVLDTTRADRLGMYGYDGNTTPRLDDWAKEARVFDHMVADAPWTLPSHASMFTGRWPIAHGAHGTPPDSDWTAGALAPGSPTVAGALRSAGYRTAAIAANRAFLQSSFGLDQGFDLYVCDQLRGLATGVPYATADRVRAMAETFLTRRTGDDPVFLFLNFLDPHTPWVPREGFVAHPERLSGRPLPGSQGWSSVEDGMYGTGVIPEGAPEAWSEAYDAELRFLDAEVGALLAELPSLGIGPEDYVFVVSDHGEYLGEHGLVEHSKDVYREVLRVPFVARGPGYPPGRDARLLQHHDLATLLLAAAGLPSLPDAVHTTDLQVSELYWTRRKDLHRAAYGDRFKRIRRAYELGGHTLLLGSDGSREAYDLARDPGQNHDLADAGPAWLPALDARAADWLGAQVPAPLVAPGGATDTDALRELGYVQ